MNASENELLRGILFSGFSNDFPLIICREPMNEKHQTVYFVPRSIFFSESLGELSKSKRIKTIFPSIGARVYFKANADNVAHIIDQNQLRTLNPNEVKSLRIHSYDIVPHLSEGNHTRIRCICIVSPEKPPRYWTSYTKESKNVQYDKSPHLEKIFRALPNVVYEAHIRVFATVIGDYKNDLTSIELRDEFCDFVKPFVDNSTGENEILLRTMEWNTTLQQNGILPNPQRRKGHLIPKDQIDVAEFYYVQSVDRQTCAIWIENPKWPILVSVVDNCRIENVNRTNFSPQDGCRVQAKLKFCSFNYAYVAYDCKIISDKHPSLRLDSKAIVENTTVVNYYFVEVMPSHYTGFYVSKKLDKVLISDPQGLLRNIDRETCNECPVWIKLNDFSQIDKCSIVEKCENLKESSSYESYADSKKKSAWPNITGMGFLVNKKTGLVFSRDNYLPFVRIILSTIDRQQVKIGEYFNFNCVYHHKRRIYLVVDLQLAIDRTPVTYFEENGEIQFIDSDLSAFTLQCLNTHYSLVFGFVEDPDLLVTDDLLKSHDAYLCEITDSINKFVMFKVHSLHPKNNRRKIMHTTTSDCKLRSSSRKMLQGPCNTCIDAIRTCRKLLNEQEILGFLVDAGLFDKVSNCASTSLF